MKHPPHVFIPRPSSAGTLFLLGETQEFSRGRKSLIYFIFSSKFLTVELANMSRAISNESPVGSRLGAKMRLTRLLYSISTFATVSSRGSSLSSLRPLSHSMTGTVVRCRNHVFISAINSNVTLESIVLSRIVRIRVIYPYV